MKNLIKLFTTLCVLGFALASCEGPMGLQGEPGVDGVDGVDGKDANESCTQCHTNSQAIEVRMAQWEASVHATGGNAERNEADCAPCHTSQGFLEVNAAGGFTSGPGLIEASATVSNPSQQNCYTCHDIHNTFTAADWAFTKTAATTASHTVDGTSSVSMDMGSANVCTGCHQGRALDEALDMTDNVNTQTPGSYRFGIHHGPQYNITMGKTLYEFAGTATYPTTENHITAKTEDACVDCHMSEEGDLATAGIEPNRRPTSDPAGGMPDATRSGRHPRWVGRRYRNYCTSERIPGALLSRWPWDSRECSES